MASRQIRLERGVPVVISAPSGAGKTTICKALLEGTDGLGLSISHTTRLRRGNEKNGVDYHFLGKPDFREMIEAGAFVEWAEVHDHLYGTSTAGIASRLDEGLDVLLDIDIQGGYQVKERFPEALLLFIVPPSMAELERRLRGRGTDSDEAIARRLANARQELDGARGYDRFVVNDKLEVAVRTVEAIILSDRNRRAAGSDLVDRLLAEG